MWDWPVTSKDESLFLKSGRDLNLYPLGFPAGITIFSEEVRRATMVIGGDGAYRVHVYVKCDRMSGDVYFASGLLTYPKAEKIVDEINKWCDNRGKDPVAPK